MPAPEQSAPPDAAMTPAVAPPDMTPAAPGINPQVAPPPPAGGTPVGTPNPPKHAALLNMIQGLAVGLGAASKSIATHGREGGAEEVQRFQGEQQRQKNEADAAATAKKSAEIQHTMWNGEINKTNLNNMILGATVKDQVDESHFKAQEAQTSAASAKYSLFAGTGMNPAQIDQLVKGGPTDAKTSNQIQANAQMNHRIAEQLLPADNPSLVALKKAIDDPSTPPGTLITLNNRLQAELKGQEGVNDAKIKEATAQATAPFGEAGATKMNDIMLKRYQASNKGATELPQGYAMDANSTPKDLDRVDKILQQTETAQNTQANRDIVNGMRQEMLNLAKGAQIPGDETKTGDEYIASLPVGTAGTIKAIHEGREAPPPAGSRSAAAQTILGALNHAYPDYDATKYPSYLEVRKKFTGGPEGKGINALNTVETHLARMFDHATAPGTSGGLTGKVTGFFGDKDVRALDIDRTAVSTELSKAYAAGQISEGEVKDWESKLDFTTPGMTTGKLITNLKEIDGLLEGKQKAYEQQWSTAAPAASIASPVPIISSEAAAARAKIRGEAAQAGGHVIDINGVHYTYNGSGDTSDLKNYTKK
jgi:hypothetical protein